MKTLVTEILKTLNNKQKKQLAFVQLLFCIMSVTQITSVAFIAPFLSLVTDREYYKSNKLFTYIFNYFQFQEYDSFLIFIGVLIILAILLSNILTIFATWYSTKFALKLGGDLSCSLFGYYLNKEYLFHTYNHSSKLTANIHSELSRVMNKLLIPLLNINSKMMMALLILSGLLYIDPVLTLLTLVTLGGSYVAIYYFVRKRLSHYGKIISKLAVSYHKTMNEGFGSIKEAKLLGNEGKITSSFHEIVEDLAIINSKSHVIEQSPRYILEAIAFSGILSITIFLLSQGNDFSKTLPLLSLYAIAGYKLLPALQSIFGSFAKVRTHSNAFMNVRDDLISAEGLTFSDIRIKNDHPKPFKKLSLKDITFKYPSSSTLNLNKVTLSIEANKSIAFVGPTGSGKTTLVDVILGLLTPSEGTLSVDGVKLCSSTWREFQDGLSYVPQSIYLSDASIKANIAFGQRENEIDKEKVKVAAKTAELAEYIEALPEGYETEIGERGVRLSGGQRQRIGIARSIYFNASVLVLDEATSALDGITENAIMQSIEKLLHKKTIIMIAHRLSTVRNCDVIYMLEKGKIVDSGTYDELLLKSEIFRKMTNIEKTKVLQED